MTKLNIAAFVQLYRTLLCRAFVCVLLVGAGSSEVFAAEPTEQDIETLELLITTTAGLSLAEVDALSNDLRQARGQLLSLKKRQEEVDAYQVEVAVFAERSQALQAEIKQLTRAMPDALPEQLDEVSLTASTYELEARVQQLRQAHFEAREQEFRLGQRAAEISRDIATAVERLNQTGSAGSEVNWNHSRDSEGGSTSLRVSSLVERVGFHVGSESISLLQRELSTLAPRQTLASLQGRAIQLSLEIGTQDLDKHWSRLNQIRIEKAQNQLNRLTQLPDANETDTASDTSIANRIRWTRNRLELLEQELNIQQRTAQTIGSIMEVYQIRYVLAQISDTGSLNDSMADLVRTLRRQLPDAAALSSELKKLRRTKRTLQVERILWESVLRGKDSTLRQTTSPDNNIQELSGGSLGSLVQLMGVANRVSDQMIALETVLSEVQLRANEVTATLDGRVLWLRTTATAELAWISNSYTGLQWISSPEAWSGVGSSVLSGARENGLPLVLLLLCLFSAVVFRPRLLALIRLNAKGIGNVSEDGYWSTPVVIGVTLLLVLPLPLVFALLYYLLDGAFVLPDSIIPALIAVVFAMGIVLTGLLFLKGLCRRDGVFRKHFEWNEASVDRLRNHLRWFVWWCTLCTGVFTFSMLSGRTDLRYGLGVIAFIAGSTALSVLLYVCFRPGKGLAFNLFDYQTREQPALERLGIWLLILFPAVVGLLPLAGYLDTAAEIQSRTFLSTALLVVTVVLIGLMLREFMVVHRRISLRKAREKRASRELERAAQLNAPVSGDATPDLTFAWDDDYKRIALQANQLLKLIGIVFFAVLAWLLWKPLFPVLNVFNDVVLWKSSGSASSLTGEYAITLGKLLFAFGVVVLGVIGSRNLRGLLEILVFERLKLDTGARYAINAIVSYTLMGTALLVGISQLGVDWSRLQWIVAALGVGLGFGLQEIVANFISGLIILFERPVRVGDTVTIGGVSGTVSNIQIRATTLTDFDNLEVLLPNKSIITENVTNWTLHDSVTRLILYIGVAYGSDIEQVRHLLMRCTDQIDDVLKHPEPTVFFVKHGENSLDFEIRAFVATTAHRMPVTDALNTAINRSLTEHGIEIPFPQRVVHMMPSQ